MSDERKTSKKDAKKEEIPWVPKKSVMIEIQESVRKKPKETTSEKSSEGS